MHTYCPQKQIVLTLLCSLLTLCIVLSFKWCGSGIRLWRCCQCEWGRSMQHVCYWWVHLLQEGLTPLHLAALYGSEEIVRILVQEFQLNPNVADYVSPFTRIYVALEEKLKQIKLSCNINCMTNQKCARYRLCCSYSLFMHRLVEQHWWLLRKRETSILYEYWWRN